MLERENFYNLTHFEYGVADYGSYKGMRYRIALEPLVKLYGKKKEDWPEVKFRVYAWPESLCFDAAPEKEYAEFEYSEEGMLEAIAYLNEKWNTVYSHITYLRESAPQTSEENKKPQKNLKDFLAEGNLQ